MTAALVIIADNLPAQAAAGATTITPIGEIPLLEAAQCVINRVVVVAPALVTGTAGPNNATINVRRWRNGVLVETTATITLAVGTNLPQSTAVPLVVTGSPYCAPGDVFDVQCVQNGTGLALPAFILAQVEVGA
jgi:hypothetical protein